MQETTNHQSLSAESDQQHQNFFEEEYINKQPNPLDSQLIQTNNKTNMDMVIEKINLILTFLVILLILVFIILPNEKQKGQLSYKAQDSDGDSTKTQILVSPSKNNEDSNILQIYNGNQQQQQQQQQQVKKVLMRQEQKSIELKKEPVQYKSLYHDQRSKIFKTRYQKEQHCQYLKLAKYNLNLPQIDRQERQILFQEEEQRLQKKYRIKQYKEELSICAVVYAHNNSQKKYSHQYVLNSIFNQNYRQYSVVYIADGHNKEQIKPIQQYIKRNDVDKRVTLVWQSERKYFLKSVITMLKTHCMTTKVAVIIDGNDQLLGRQVFKLLNARYRRYNLNIVYGNFLQYYEHIHQIQVGFSSQYGQEEKKQSSYRLINQKFGRIMSFKTNLISFIQESDLKDDKGEYYKEGGDYALIYPLLELSCGSVQYFSEYNYLYYGQQLEPQAIKLQFKNGQEIKSKPHYKCFKQYT